MLCGKCDFENKKETTHMSNLNSKCDSENNNFFPNIRVVITHLCNLLFML